MQDTTSVSTLLDVKHNLFISQSPMSETEKQAYKEYAGNIYYFFLVGFLLYVT